MIKTAKGMLVEYALSLPPLVLEFEFNPETLTRSRTVSFDASALPIADFVVMARPGIAARGNAQIRASLLRHWERIANGCKR